MTRLHEELEKGLERYRPRRASEDETLFDYVLTLADEEGNWHTLRSSVDDTTAPGYLFVIAVSYKSGKYRL